MFTNLAPEVATIPLILLVISKLFVLVEIFKLLLFTIVVVEIDPPILETILFPIDESVLATFKLAILKLEMVALVNVEFVKIAEADLSMSTNKLVEVELEKVALPSSISILETLVEDKLVVPVAFRLVVLMPEVCKLFPVADLNSNMSNIASVADKILANRFVILAEFKVVDEIVPVPRLNVLAFKFPILAFKVLVVLAFKVVKLGLLVKE